jgi:hypothetical protein
MSQTCAAHEVLDVDEASTCGPALSAPAAPRRETFRVGACPSPNLLLAAKSYGLADLHALGARAVSQTHRQSHETSPSRGSGDQLANPRSPMRSARERTRAPFLSISR